MTDSTADVLVREEGDRVLLQPRTDLGSRWIEDNVERGAQWVGGWVVVGRKTGWSIMDEMEKDGLEVFVE
jgi:hypothetical protein